MKQLKREDVIVENETYITESIEPNKHLQMFFTEFGRMIMKKKPSFHFRRGTRNKPPMVGTETINGLYILGSEE